MQHRSSLLAGTFAVLVVTVLVSLWMLDFLNTDLIFKPWHTQTSLDSHPSNMSLSDVFFPVLDDPAVDPVVRENSKVLNALVACMEHKNCHQNQTKVVILASSYFRDYLSGSRGGESIWAHSAASGLANMGYTVLHTPYPSLPYAIQLYKIFPDLVKLVMMDSDDASSCYNDLHNCRVSRSNPTGIPPWKIFTFVFWPGPHNPLGLKWTLSPENFSAEGRPESTYLGYSIEESCRKHPFVPHSERENQAWVLAKYLHYFSPQFSAAWSKEIFDAATTATGITFGLGAIVRDHPEVEPELPSSYMNYGQLNQSVFLRHLSNSRVLIGMGNPLISPTPYDALCLGVPFINPISDWDHDNPANSSRWATQHNALRDLGPPYVYNVFNGDTQGFVQAVKDALANPIDSYILPRMTMSAVEARLSAILETDWRHEADLLDTPH